MRYRSIALLVLALAVAFTALFLRRRTRSVPPSPEGEVALPTPSIEPSAPADRAPTSRDVQPTMDRSFEGALVPDRQARPAFVIGDFNGDGVTDLAMAARPRDGAAAAALDGDVPRFRIQDATAAIDRASAGVKADEPLLAIVHGVAGVSWQDDADRPAFLVRHADGRRMRTRPLADVPAGVRMRIARAHAGDVIALDRNGRAGLILWTGAAYAWSDLNAGAARALP